MKLSPVVIVALVIVALIVGFVVLYHKAKKHKRLGLSLAALCAVAGRILVKITEFTSSAAGYFKNACLASLRYPPGVSDSDYWSGVNVIARLVYFVLAVCILVGESVNTLLVLPALLQITSNVHLPGIIELASAALFICCPALAGSAIFELCGLIPHGAGLFPRLNKVVRLVLGVFLGVVLILSILETGYFYGFRALYILSPDSTQGMTIYILAGLGLETAAVAVLALWALVVGGAGVVSCVCWALEMIARGMSALVSLPPHQLDTIALHLSGDEIGVWGEQIERDPHKYPSLFGSADANLQPGHTNIVELPEHAETIDDDTDNVQIFPVLTPELEKKMSKPDHASINFVGQYGTRQRPFVVRKFDKLHAKDSILTSGWLDFSINHLSTAIPGIVDISLPLHERIASSLHGKNEGETYQTALNRFGDRLVEPHLSTPTPSVLMFVIDCRLLVYAVDMLESIKRRLPRHSLVVLTSVSDQDAQNITVHTGIVDMQSLWAEDIIETVFVTSPRSDFASAYGEETQLNFTAQALVSLVLGQQHNLSNRSFTNVLQELHSLSPFVTLSFASEAVALGDVARRYKWIPGMSRSAGAHTGDFSDIVLQARNVATRCITDADTRAFDAEVNADNPCVVVFNTPIQLRDPRINEFSRVMALWTTSNFPFASSITVRGNGCAYPYHLGGKFLVQASCIYPLQPSSYPRLQPERSVKVTPLYPLNTALETVQGNGRVHSEQHLEPDTKKPASSSRKMKAPARRVVVRKNTKQAK